MMPVLSAIHQDLLNHVLSTMISFNEVLILFADFHNLSKEDRDSIIV